MHKLLRISPISCNYCRLQFTIEVLGGRGADVVPGFLFCHAHHHLTSIDSKEFRILSACRPLGQPLLFISSV